MKRFVMGALILSICFAAVGFAQEADTVEVREARFVFDDPVGRNIVTFSSHAPLETVIGRTSALYGHLFLNLDSLSEKTEAYFECDLSTLATGVRDRDADMLSDKYLAVDSFPTATFKLLTIKKTDFEVLNNEGQVILSGRGEFNLRGVLDTVNVEATLTYFKENKVTATRLPGDILKLKADFDIRMSNYGIKIPDTAFLMLDDRIHVEINAFGATGVQPIDRNAPAAMPVEMPVEEPADKAVKGE
ncbi:MAG: YceI family protein [candidate division Zixibacteria bacterium]|nr:YceI family protein [candidate division Zixibacteria bacterium]MBU1470800.1 YceI family protein [candidate division Zixibacteria bacterium]